MERIWAPWRAQYIHDSAAESPGEPACFLCRGLSAADDRAHFLIWRRPASVVYLNRYPYNNGHLLVAPLVHKSSLVELTGAELTEPLETIRLCLTILDRMIAPQGYNIGLNLGKSAGAGLPGHVHWHVVPRWDGDTNFMPVVADSKVIVESLHAFHERWNAELTEFDAERAKS